MGQSSIEVWQNTANETGFPFSRSTVIPRGLAGQWAVAGWEPGFANALTWVGDDNIVYRLNGYSPERISNNDIERDISRQADKTALRACCYMSEGNAIWSIKGDAFCWEFNLSTGQWHERASHLSSTWIGEQTVNLNNIWYAGGVTTGDIYKIDATYYYEGGEPLVWLAQSGPGNAFPQKLAVTQAQFSFDTGVGLDTGTDPIQTDPVVEISWSDDGGNSFGMAVRRNLGREANTRIPVTVNRCGMAYGQGRVWKLEISDPVYRGLIGGDMTVEGRT
jgi:hypothetical protein